MLKPKGDEYYRYYQDDEIVVMRLPSEAPKGFDERWHIRLEQMLVDILTDKLISRIVSNEEKQEFVRGAFATYLVDEKAMNRYARRKGSGQKTRQELDSYKKADAV